MTIRTRGVFNKTVRMKACRSRVEQDDIRCPDLVGVEYHLANVVELVRIPSQQNISPPLQVSLYTSPSLIRNLQHRRQI